MTVTQLRQRHAMLEAVRLDLAKWGLGSCSSRVSADAKPIVAVDWSEIFSYLTYTPPRRNDAEDFFAIYYAGLSYLLFKLPCRLVLLPPYAEEMSSFVSMIRGRALLFEHPDKNLVERYSTLLDKLERLKTTNPEFAAILRGEWEATSTLSGEAWDVLENLLREDLPSLFLDVQERTADAMRSLLLLTKATDPDQTKRLKGLTALKAPSEKACTRSLEGWSYWLSEMSLQRPRQERQNRADALALAYLQAMHQECLGRGVPVYFASRSLSMLHVMENHSGEFQPYALGDADSTRRSRSSWRFWDYFAELGYYSTWRQSNGDDEGCADIEHDLLKREGKLAGSIVARQNDSAPDQEVADSLADWDTLRGSFDLEGFGSADHWKRLQNPQEHLLVDLLKSVLSAEDASAFLKKRGELARKILEDIEAILGNFVTADALLVAQPGRLVKPPQIGAVAVIATSHLSIAAAFEDYLRMSVRRLSHEFGREVLTQLRRATTPPEGQETINAAHRLLHLLAGEVPRDVLSQAAKDWLIGTALFFAGMYDKSVTYLASWIGTHSSAAPSRLGLATRALCAEAYRQQRDYEPGMQLLFDLQEEKRESMAASERLVWHCLTGQLLLDWMEPCKENFEVFPRPLGKRSEDGLIVPMLKPVVAFGQQGPASNSLYLTAANILLYLVARHIPENARELIERENDRSAASKGRLAWFFDNQGRFEDIERSLRAAVAETSEARELHTLGYYNWKVYLLTKDVKRCEVALRDFDEAKSRAERRGDLTILRLVQEHCKWARQTLRRPQTP
jgi:tetratricopeptide (TPR) repeat protein